MIFFLKNNKMLTSSKLNLICSCFTICIISVPTLLVEARSMDDARILNQNNGWDRAPVTEMVQNFSVNIPPPPRAPAKIISEIPVGAENQLLATYLVPPPPPPQVNQNIFVASEPDPMHQQHDHDYHHPNHNYDVKPLKVTAVTNTAAVVGSEVIQNNYDASPSGTSTTGNLYVKPNEHKINTIIAASQVSRVKPGQNVNKVKRKVNVEKFKECIFFRLCEKAKCFHYGRFGVCQGQGL